MKSMLRPATIWQWTMRLLWYVIGATTVFLLVATVAPRFLHVEEPWLFFLLGGLVGLPVAAMSPLMGLFSTPAPFRTSILLLGMVVVTVIVSVLVSLALPGIDLGAVGIVLAALGVSAVSYVVYLIQDAPEPPSHES